MEIAKAVGIAVKYFANLYVISHMSPSWMNVMMEHCYQYEGHCPCWEFLPAHSILLIPKILKETDSLFPRVLSLSFNSVTKFFKEHWWLLVLLHFLLDPHLFPVSSTHCSPVFQTHAQWLPCWMALMMLTLCSDPLRSVSRISVWYSSPLYSRAYHHGCFPEGCLWVPGTALPECIENCNFLGACVSSISLPVPSLKWPLGIDCERLLPCKV